MSRQSVVSVRLAGLERAQRFAGESFGHEELGTLPRLSQAALLSARWLWGLCAFVAILGLAALHAR